MNETARKNLTIKALDGFESTIGCYLWELDDTRARTWRILEGIAPAVIDWQPPLANGNSIGTLLYHIAAIEMDWLYNEVMETKLPDKVWENFPYPVRDSKDHLTVVAGLSLDDHFKRLDSTRQLLLSTFNSMTLDDFRRLRHLERYDVSPEWVIHHLMQHEAEHRGEMAVVRALAERESLNAT
ncbi:MAG: DinB family protein [Anaerolineae bacterium]